MSTPQLPFDDSRRLAGWNPYFADVGAALETQGIAVDDELLARWRDRVMQARSWLDWPDGAIVARRHAGGASLALAAPVDQLLTATEVDEWALLAACEGMASPFHAPGHPAAWDADSASRTLRALAAGERNPRLAGLWRATHARGLDLLFDDEAATVGAGDGARTWPLQRLPAADEVPWASLRDVPVALITGSNGKTTTTRLLTAMLRAQGRHVAHTCTDGVFVDGALVAGGDYSGPAGARAALRAPGIDAAVLETARGGLLRRGLAVQHADVAVVTNISDDHFGEYGIHDLSDLAFAKIAVARALRSDGWLVLNADDPLLRAQAGAGLPGRIAWFALDADTPLPRAHRAGGGATCGGRDGRLVLHVEGADRDLGAIDAMPLTLGGSARYNIANLAAAALAAHRLGVDIGAMVEVAARFGARAEDNPGRLQLVRLGDVSVLVDYVHNADGWNSLADVLDRLRGGRLGLMLGHAGNRGDAELRDVAQAVAELHPDHVVLKDIGGMLRGRQPGDVARVLRDALIAKGVDVGAVAVQLDEYAAVCDLLAWAQPGDLLVLPVHGSVARKHVAMLLDALRAAHWRAGRAFDASGTAPPEPPPA